MTNYIFFNKTHFCLSKALWVNGILLACLALIEFSGIAQVPPALTWQKSFGGDSSDYAAAIQQTADGGYIVAGRTYSNSGDVTGNHGDSDYWIVKLDANSNLTWQKSLGGDSIDYATSIQQTSDGGYIVAGYSVSQDGDVTGNHGGYDYWIVKLAANGNLSWQKSLGGSGYDRATSIQETTDGGYIVAGYSESNDGDVMGNHGYDYWIVKLAVNGNLAWQKCLGGSGIDGATSIQQTTDGGYIVAGYSYSIDGDVTGNHGYEDYWIVKLDENGNLSWQKSFGGSGTDWAHSIQQTTDGGYIVSGMSGSYDGDVTGNHGGSDSWIVKLDVSGTLVWQKCLGGSNYERAYSIQQATEGGYIVAGVSSSIDGDVTGNHGAGDYWIVKLAANGMLSWQKSIGGSGEDWNPSIQQATDGGYIVTGSTYSNDGDVTENHGGYDYWIVKLGGFGVDIEELSNVMSLNVSPNPAVGNSVSLDYYLLAATKVEISMIDVLGNCVVYMEKGIEATGEQSRVIDVGHLTSGMYFLELRTNYGREIVKWVKE